MSLNLLEQISKSKFPEFRLFPYPHLKAAVKAFSLTNYHVFLSSEHKCTLGKFLHL